MGTPLCIIYVTKKLVKKEPLPPPVPKKQPEMYSLTSSIELAKNSANIFVIIHGWSEVHTNIFRLSHRSRSSSVQ